MSCEVCHGPVSGAATRCRPCYLTEIRTGELTAKQASILRYILDCYSDGWLPTQEEISTHLGNTSTCHRQMLALERKGWIVRRANLYQVTKQARELPK